MQRQWKESGCQITIDSYPGSRIRKLYKSRSSVFLVCKVLLIVVAREHLVHMA